MTTNTTDADAILAEPSQIELISGTKVNVERIKTVQMLRLLRVFTKGIGDLSALNLDPESETFSTDLISAAIFAIPEAEGETIDFIHSLISPVDLIKEPKSKADREKNTEILTAFFLEVQNPEIDDLITIVETVITNEGPHLAALGKRVAALLQVQKKSATAKAATKKK